MKGKTLTKIVKLKQIVILVLGVTLGVLLGILGGSMLLRQSKQFCEKANGNTHVYSNQCLPSNFGEPVDLVQISPRASFLEKRVYLRKVATDVVEKLVRDAERDGMCLVVVSAYRPTWYQAELYEGAEDKTLVALPGRSEHQTGLAIDFGGCALRNGVRDDSAERLGLANPKGALFAFALLPEYRWLKNHASEYGLEESYTKSNSESVGYPEEQWHWKLVLP